MTLVRSDEGRSSLRPVEVQQPRQESLVLDEEIDLRELVRLLIQHWKAIAGVLMVFVAAAFILNTFVLTPTYESYAVVTFRNADLGLDLPVLRALASSPAVMTEIQRQVGFEGQLGELAERFEFVVESSGSLFTVKAQSDDPRHAELLVRAWIAAVESQVSQALEGRLAQQVSNAEANFSAARAALSEAEEALAAFDREHPLDLMEARLWRGQAKAGLGRGNPGEPQDVGNSYKGSDSRRLEGGAEPRVRRGRIVSIPTGGDGEWGSTDAAESYLF